MSIPPIPAHLARYDWYAPHLAWLVSQGMMPRHDPGGAPPVRADLRDANLRCVDFRRAHLSLAIISRADLRDANLRDVDLRDADLRGAVLRGASLNRAILSRADLSDAILNGAILRGAVLRGASLSRADLRDANLRCVVLNGADLSDAALRGANLYGAAGIASAGPVGRQGCIIYAFRRGDGVMIQAGCWLGTLADTEARIMREYDGDPWRDAYLAVVRAAAASVMATP